MKQNSPEMVTDRLILRKFSRKDLPDLFKIFSDKEVNEFLPMFPLKSLEEAQVFFEKEYLEAYKQPSGYKYAICLKADNKAIGYVNLTSDDSNELGYGLLKEHWHKGIVSEACRAVIERAGKDGVLFITATHDINNPRSGSVMKALGMKYRYSYTEQWQPKNIPVTFRLYQLNFDNSDREYKKYWEEHTNHFIETAVS